MTVAEIRWEFVSLSLSDWVVLGAVEASRVRCQKPIDSVPKSPCSQCFHIGPQSIMMTL